MAKILSGRAAREKITVRLKQKIKGLRKVPTLVILQVGNLSESNAYIRQKKLFADLVGARVVHVIFPHQVKEAKLLSDIEKFNNDKSIQGIIIQMPLPPHLDKERVIEKIAPKKDVDGLHSVNVKKLWIGDQTGIRGATPRGILNLLKFYKVPIKGKRVLVIGRSALVGRPTAALLLRENATVTVAHRETKNLAALTKQADILIVAAGVPNLIKEKHVRKGQVVIDVGINLVNKKVKKLQEEITVTKMVGDVDFSKVSKIVKAISPVPGGVGPMTVAALFENLVDGALR